MKFLAHKKRIQKNDQAFAMLFAVLMASLLVALGVSIFGISLKELMIATSAQDSQTAYYAADSAEECALYWDLKQGAFPTCLDSGCPADGNVSTSTNNTIVCNANPITFQYAAPVKNGAGDITYASSTINFFKFSPTDITAAVSNMSITKEFIPAGSISAGNPSTDEVQTIIIAQGHNTGVIGRRVERGISQVYNQ